MFVLSGLTKPAEYFTHFLLAWIRSPGSSDLPLNGCVFGACPFPAGSFSAPSLKREQGLFLRWVGGCDGRGKLSVVLGTRCRRIQEHLLTPNTKPNVPFKGVCQPFSTLRSWVPGNTSAVPPPLQRGREGGPGEIPGGAQLKSRMEAASSGWVCPFLGKTASQVLDSVWLGVGGGSDAQNGPAKTSGRGCLAGGACARSPPPASPRPLPRHRELSL